MIGQTISHYRVLEKLGEGGMGVVYKARDERLGRLVALKFLGDLVSLDPAALERFEREARLASALAHPNICTIYELGSQEGRSFIAMELLAGRSLRHLLAGGPLEEARVVAIAAQVADGLEAAHEQGIVHRDIKPENLFVTDRGLTKILDFGLVKRLAPRGPGALEGADDQTLSRTGAFLGTIGYMSPEQLRGAAVDQRSDLFSLGAVLYEMATGKPPFHGSTSALVADGILNRSPIRPARLNPDVSPALEAVIDRALEKEPEQRYQRAAELRADLERLTGAAAGGSTARPPEEPAGRVRAKGRWRALAAAVVLSLVAAAGVWYRDRGPSRPVRPREPSIAVLPFVDLSARRDQEYFSDGLAEELLGDLAKVPGLRVAGRTSSFRFRGGGEDLRTIGRKLNVATVLEGSVRREGDRVRITVQLIDSADGFHLWSETYDRQVRDLFELQDEIARAVAHALEVRLLAAASPAPPTPDLEAYNVYLQGQYFYQRQTKENLERAVGYFERAIDLDPAFARAWGGLGATLAYQASLGYVTPEDGYSRARSAIEKALSLDPALARAHSVLGWIQMTHDWDWPGAEASFQRCQALDPSRGLMEESMLAVALGRFDRGLELGHRAVEMDPLNTQALFALAVAAWYGGRPEEALGAYRKVLEVVPEVAAAHGLAAVVHLSRSEPEEALREVEQEKEPYWRLYALALVDHALGRREESEAALAELIARFQDGGAYQVAQVYAAYGDADRSIEWLERAHAQRDGGLFLVAVDPLLETLKGDPRFVDLLERMKLTRPDPAPSAAPRPTAAPGPTVRTSSTGRSPRGPAPPAA